MSGFLMRGALVEYTTDVLGPLPNIVVFQFNPEQLVRTLNIASRKVPGQESSKQLEPNQTGAPPTETFTVTAHFSAADELGKGGPESSLARTFGVGPQLAALEKMVYPAGGIISGAISAALDAVGEALDIGGDGNGARRPIPREQVPRILFIWGISRVLPVEIQSMSITEQKFDAILNPLQAQVEIGLAVASYPIIKKKPPEDPVGIGALKYTQTLKDTMAALNLSNAVKSAVDIIPF